MCCVPCSAVEYAVSSDNLNLSAIRTVRVLRPIRAINRIPSQYSTFYRTSFSSHQHRKMSRQISKCIIGCLMQCIAALDRIYNHLRRVRCPIFDVRWIIPQQHASTHAVQRQTVRGGPLLNAAVDRRDMFETVNNKILENARVDRGYFNQYGLLQYRMSCAVGSAVTATAEPLVLL